MEIEKIIMDRPIRRTGSQLLTNARLGFGDPPWLSAGEKRQFIEKKFRQDFQLAAYYTTGTNTRNRKQR